MRDFALVVAGGVLAALLTLLGSWAFENGTAEMPVPRPGSTAATIAPPATAPAAAPDVTRLEAQIEKLTTAVNALEIRVAGQAERMSASAPVGAVPAVDGDALVRAFELADAKKERAKLDALTPEEMKVAARALLHDKKDAAGARRMLEALLERPLTPVDRAKAMTELGIVQRNTEDLVASEEALQYAVDTLGVDSEDGAWAAFQLAWTVLGKKDDARALRVFDSVARCAQVNEGIRMVSRWNAAKLALAAGDTNRARTDFANLLRDCGTKDEYHYIVVDVQARLKGL